MQASLAWADLTNPKNMVQTVVTIPEGKRASQVIAIVAKQTKFPLKDFQTLPAHPSELGLPKYADGKVEGYLFPATYAIVPHETALQILQAMVAGTTRRRPRSTCPPQPSGWASGDDVIIEASMAQAEGGSTTDYPKIAEVINNRLRIDMALQFDSVLLFGLNKYAINVTDAQIATPGAYNDFDTPASAGPDREPGRLGDPGHPAPGHRQLDLLPHRHRRQVRILRDPAGRPVTRPPATTVAWRLMKAAVLGKPIAHSLSPVLHRAAYRELGLVDWSYDLVECDEAGLPGYLGSRGQEWAGQA